jgi:hypothetical protein
MINILVANFNSEHSNSAKKYELESLKHELNAQMENSLEMGWSPEKILVVTNFMFVQKNSAIRRLLLPDLNKDCLTGSKMFAMRELFRLDMINEEVWIHDLDAWQNIPFDFPEFKDVGIAEYSRPKYNGGSVFYKPAARDIVERVCQEIERDKEKREEPVLNRILRREYADRVTTLNSTWNVGCSGFVKRYQNAEKPIKVVHFHPTNRIAWDTHVRDRNGLGEVSVSDRLKQLFVRQYGDRISRFKYDDGGEPTEMRNVR